jgi:hypothetical protein
MVSCQCVSVLPMRWLRTHHPTRPGRRRASRSRGSQAVTVWSTTLCTAAGRVVGRHEHRLDGSGVARGGRDRWSAIPVSSTRVLLTRSGRRMNLATNVGTLGCVRPGCGRRRPAPVALAPAYQFTGKATRALGSPRCRRSAVWRWPRGGKDGGRRPALRSRRRPGRGRRRCGLPSDDLEACVVPGGEDARRVRPRARCAERCPVWRWLGAAGDRSERVAHPSVRA